MNTNETSTEHGKWAYSHYLTAALHGLQEGSVKLHALELRNACCLHHSGSVCLVGLELFGEELLTHGGRAKHRNGGVLNQPTTANIYYGLEEMN